MESVKLQEEVDRVFFSSFIQSVIPTKDPYCARRRSVPTNVTNQP